MAAWSTSAALFEAAALWSSSLHRVTGSSYYLCKRHLFVRGIPSKFYRTHIRVIPRLNRNPYVRSCSSHFFQFWPPSLNVRTTARSCSFKKKNCTIVQANPPACLFNFFARTRMHDFLTHLQKTYAHKKFARNAPKRRHRIVA